MFEDKKVKRKRIYTLAKRRGQQNWRKNHEVYHPQIALKGEETREFLDIIEEMGGSTKNAIMTALRHYRDAVSKWK